MVEAVESMASPDVCAEILRTALTSCRLDRIPEQGPAVTEFVETALFVAAESRLGEETAIMIVEQLRPIASMAARQEVSEVRPSHPAPPPSLEGSLDAATRRGSPSSGARRATAREPLVLESDVPTESGEGPALVLESEPAWAPLELEPDDPAGGLGIDSFDATWADDDDDEPMMLIVDADDDEAEVVLEVDDSEPPPGRKPAWTDPAPDSMALVLVSTADPQRVAALGRALLGIATVQPVSDALAILAENAEIVVIDCVRPTLRLETLLSVAPELPEQCRVVLWGEQHDLQKRLGSLGGGVPEEWVRCGHDADAEDVGTVCRVLLE